MNEPINWTTSWDVFTNLLQDKIAENRSTQSLAAFFGGKLVQWKGIIDDMDLDDLSPSIGIALPERIIHINNTDKARLVGISLPPASDAIDQWARLKVGDRVIFQAVLGRADSPFPPIEPIQLSSDRTILRIRMGNGRPLNPAPCNQMP